MATKVSASTFIDRNQFQDFSTEFEDLSQNVTWIQNLPHMQPHLDRPVRKCMRSIEPCLSSIRIGFIVINQSKDIQIIREFFPAFQKLVQKANRLSIDCMNLLLKL